MGYVSLSLVVVSAGIPLLFKYGKPLRRWTSGKINKQRTQKWHDAPA